MLFDFFKNKDTIEKEEEKENIILQKNFKNFNLVTEYIYQKSGITDLEKRALVSSRLTDFAMKYQINTTDSFIEKMQIDNEFYQNVVNIVTVNETYFFREKEELDFLTQYITKEFRSINILSMPSSSGEEVYWIMILLHLNGVDISKVQITGYDINSYAIKNALNGVYDQKSLHKVNESIKTQYFTLDGMGYYHIKDFIKNNTHFIQKNIFEISSESDKYDVVLSRNMFIYFNDEKRVQALNIIIDLLKNNGIYIKGHADNIKINHSLKNIQFGVYQKIRT